MGVAASMNRAQVDTNAVKTPVPLPLAAWQTLSSTAAAREVHARVDALPAALRSAALAWLRPERELAEALDAADRAQPLRGVPYLVKDLFDVAGVPTRAGSAFLDRARPTPGDSTLVRRLRAVGAACAGKTHLVEFAAGLTGENRTFGDCPHPHFPDRLAGGSSSGSAALVAAGVVPFAIGTDTGGSVRVPAAFCGVHGFRGIPGHAFIRDAVPLSPTCDTAGWFTREAADMQTVLAALIGPATALARPPRGVFLRATDLLPDADPAVDAACARHAAAFCPAADELTRRGLLADWSEAVAAYTAAVTREAHDVHRNWLAPYREHYDPSIWQRFTDAGKLPEETLAAARAVFGRIRASFAAYFATHDFLVLPCAPLPALTKAQCTPEVRRSILTFTTPASLAGLPCLTVPVALPGGLTAGLQVLAAREDSPVFTWWLEQAAR